jgi:hypothetical protein
MQLRVARHTERLDEVVGFYRDGIGLIEIGGFRDHDGYDGVFLATASLGAALVAIATAIPTIPLDDEHLPELDHTLVNVLAHAIAAVALSEGATP